MKTRLSRKQPETVLRDNIKAALNRTLRVRLVVNPVGFDPRARRDYGLGEGSPDLVGTLRCGRTFCIEVKEPKNGRVRRAQAAWWRAARKWGVLGGFARSIEDAKRLLEHEERVASRDPVEAEQWVQVMSTPPTAAAIPYINREAFESFGQEK